MFALHFAHIFAQQRTEPDPAAGAAGGLATLLCCGIFFGIPLLLVCCGLAATFWMAKDAKSRGMEPGMWVILTWLTGPIGIAIYLFSRSQGVLVQCPHCGNNRMEASVRCPHCGSEEQARPPRRRRVRRRDEDEEEYEEED